MSMNFNHIQTSRLVVLIFPLVHGTLPDLWIHLANRGHDVIGVLPCELRVQGSGFSRTGLGRSLRIS